MVERGAEHLKALCVVAGALAERGWTVMNRQMPYVICDTDGNRSPRHRRNRSSREHFTVPDEVRGRRRSSKARRTGEPNAAKGEGPSASRTRRHDTSHGPR